MIVRNIRNCSRCGESHDELEAIQLAQAMAPPECAPLKWTHYAMCPNGCGPIMLACFDNPSTDGAIKAPRTAAFASPSLCERFGARPMVDVTESYNPERATWHHVDVYLTPEAFVSYDVHEWIRTQLGPRCASITIKAVHD